MPRLEVLGWWFHERAPDEWPRPQRLVRRWNANDRALVVRYLRGGRTLVRYGATSPCRFACGVRHVGRRDLTDGTFVWPDGLAHYVERHAVRLPPHFVAHVRANGGRVAPFVPPRPRAGLYDASPWRRWARAQRACVDLRGWRRPSPDLAVRLAARTGDPTLAADDVLLHRSTPRAIVVARADGRLTLVPLHRGGRRREFAGWRNWPVRR